MNNKPENNKVRENDEESGFFFCDDVNSDTNSPFGNNIVDTAPEKELEQKDIIQLKENEEPQRVRDYEVIKKKNAAKAKAARLKKEKKRRLILISIIGVLGIITLVLLMRLLTR